jgi:hypothetical protein
MGREVRRVALDFQWPLDRVWEGFLNPHHETEDCKECKGSGSGPEARALSDLWYGYVPFDPASTGSAPFTVKTPEVRAFAERNCRQSPDFYGDSERAIVREGERLCRLFNGQWSHHLSQDDVDALVAAGRLRERDGLPDFKADTVNRWSIGGFGHDGINQHVVVKARLEKQGISELCPHCKGEGFHWKSEEGRLRQESWTPTPPPEGEGYQLWETVSEGSPISPVFAAPEDLATWLVGNARRIDSGTTYDQWLAFIAGPGWAPSMIISGGQMMSGVEAVARAS